MEYDLELENIVKTIKKQKAKTVLIQLPDGLKDKALDISNFIEKNTNAKCFIWLESCFGACDTPNFKNIEKDVDLLVQFGHSKF
ncbi:MAG: diphthamide synthesis protein [Candidatus Nanoarchaeia archaeon]|nr:diphthamide synthesis protein [Candidatus Nanoarchaeia archaeon]MDD5588153.1 diphthamide synthesis protein [Candidatus Nanoarchaeia archaeon]